MVSVRPEAGDTATIVFASRTTGKGKGVMLTQENLASNVLSVEFKAEPGKVILSALPIHHAFCLVMDWLKRLSLGAMVCINDSLMRMVKNMGATSLKPPKRCPGCILRLRQRPRT